jgi:hypothetical protein
MTKKVTCRIYISVTSSSSPGFIYLRASHRYDLFPPPDEHCCSNICTGFFLFEICTARVCLSRPICCWTVNLFSATTYVSHILKYKMWLPVENTCISSPNSGTICFKLYDLCGFALGILIKWVTLVQHRTELFTPRTFRQLYLCLHGQGRNGRQGEFYWTTACHMKRGISIRNICN